MFTELNQRSLDLEILDQGFQHYTLEEYRDCLWKLDKIGRWLGGDRASFKALAAVPPPLNSILDVGCGGGLFTIQMGRAFPNTLVKGMDINPLAIAFAKELKAPSNVMFELGNSPELKAQPESYDVIIATLVCHHMQDQDLIEFLKKAHQVARKKVIINDLHRHPAALCLFKVVSPIFFNNRLVLHDGLISIKKGFQYDDWIRYLTAANISSKAYKIQRRWAYRWVIEIDRTLD